MKKTKSLFGPTTRSRSNAPPVKDVTSDKEVNDANHEEHVPIQLPEAGGKGTVDDYMAMRKRQRENSVKAATTKKPPQPAEPSLADYEDGEENEGQHIFLSSFFLYSLAIKKISQKLNLPDFIDVNIYDFCDVKLKEFTSVKSIILNIIYMSLKFLNGI